MARNTQFLNQALCTVVGYGTPDVDFFSGDAIRIIPNAEGSSMEVGLDGSTTTFSTDQSGTFEVDFKQNSVSLDKYQGIWKRQKTAQASLGNIQIFTSAAEPIRLEGCSISNIGQKGTGGKTASAQTVVFNVQKIIYP
jgi:hypothetical protein